MDLSYDLSKASGAPLRSSVGFEEDMGEGGLGNGGGEVVVRRTREVG